MFRFRHHRGSLFESLKTTVEVSNFADLVQYLTKYFRHYPEFDGVISEKTVHVKKYVEGVDPRCGWNTHLVTLDGFGVVGMTDAMLDGGEGGSASPPDQNLVSGKV